MRRVLMAFALPPRETVAPLDSAASRRRGRGATMLGVMPVDPYALEQSLRSASSAEVRFAPPQTNDFAMTGEAIAEFFRGLVSSRIGFERTIAEVEKTRLLAEADQFFDDESRDTLRGIASVLRKWAPRFASLRAPETHPLVLAFPTFFRPYNDTLTQLVRTMLDRAGQLEARLAEEVEEDAEADAWATRHPGWAHDDEDLVPLSQIPS